MVSDGVGEKADAGLVAGAGAHDGGEFGSPGCGEGIVGELNDVEVAGLKSAKAVGEEVELLGGGLRELVGRALVGDGEIDLYVACTSRDGADKAAGDDGSGKAGLVPVEVELVARFAVGEGDRVRRSLCAAGENLHALRDANMKLSGEAIGHEARGREPARGIEEVGDGLLDGGELEAFDGAVFGTGDRAVVLEGPMSSLPGRRGGRRA